MSSLASQLPRPHGSATSSTTPPFGGVPPAPENTPRGSDSESTVHGGERGFVIMDSSLLPHDATRSSVLPRAPSMYRDVLSSAMRKMIEQSPDTALPDPLHAWTHCDALRALWSALSAELLKYAPAHLSNADRHGAVCAVMVCTIYRMPELVKAQQAVRLLSHMLQCRCRRER
jgi:hypothetical protein